MKPPFSPTCRALACGLLLGAAVLTGCSKPEAAAPAPAPAVAGNVVSFPAQKDPQGIRIATVSADAHRAITVPGRMAWDEDRTVRVWAPYGGRIERLRAAVGQPVKRGDALAELSSPDIGQAQADAGKAEADLRLARSAAERARELVTGGVIAAKELQQAEAELARAQAEAARVRARLAQYSVGAQSVTQSFVLAAPLAGVVVERNANPGAEVRPDVQGAPLFVVSDPTVLWAVLDVNETQLAAFKVGAAVELSAAAWPDERFPATVVNVGEAVDATTRTVKVRVRVPNAERRLKAEMFVSGVVQQAAALPQLPADAVFLRGEKSYAFVQQAPGRYERREVQVRSAGPQSWFVLKGVAAGERVVLGGGLYLNQLMDAL